MRELPREYAFNESASRLPNGTGFAVALAMALPLYCILAVLY